MVDYAGAYDGDSEAWVILESRGLMLRHELLGYPDGCSGLVDVGGLMFLLFLPFSVID